MQIYLLKQDVILTTQKFSNNVRILNPNQIFGAKYQRSLKFLDKKSKNLPVCCALTWQRGLKHLKFPRFSSASKYAYVGKYTRAFAQIGELRQSVLFKHVARMVDVILKVILISVLSLTFSDCQKYSKPNREYEEKVEYRNYKLVRMYTSGLNGDQNDLYNFLIPSKLKSNQIQCKIEPILLLNKKSE